MSKKRIIIKIGTNILTNNKQQIDLTNMQQIVNQISHEIKFNPSIEFLIVSSGAITSGAKHINLNPKNISEKQAAASIGQILLFQNYYDFFQANNLCIGQLLVTKDNFNHTEKKENIIQTINTLLKHKTIPIINENDSVSTEEIQFGDNDQLSAITAINIKANLLIILTNTDGVLDSNNNVIPELKKISSKELKLVRNTLLSPFSKGGMESKLLSAKLAMEHNIVTVIANGRKKNIIHKIINQEPIGTWIKK